MSIGIWPYGIQLSDNQRSSCRSSKPKIPRKTEHKEPLWFFSQRVLDALANEGKIKREVVRISGFRAPVYYIDDENYKRSIYGIPSRIRKSLIRVEIKDGNPPEVFIPPFSSILDPQIYENDIENFDTLKKLLGSSNVSVQPPKGYVSTAETDNVKIEMRTQYNLEKKRYRESVQNGVYRYSITLHAHPYTITYVAELHPKKHEINPKILIFFISHKDFVSVST